MFPLTKREGERISILSFEDDEATSAVVVKEERDEDETLKLSSVVEVIDER